MSAVPGRITTGSYPPAVPTTSCTACTGNDWEDAVLINGRAKYAWSGAAPYTKKQKRLAKHQARREEERSAKREVMEES